MAESLIEIIERLPFGELAEVKQFVASLPSVRSNAFGSCNYTASSEPAFATVWNNPEDDVYDAL